MIIQASVPGKLVLLGEYALLEGAPALVAAVNRLVNIEMRSGTRGRENSVNITHLKTGRIPVGPGGMLPGIAKYSKQRTAQIRAISTLLESSQMLASVHHKTGGGFDLTIDAGSFFSDHGIKLGLGSSAAITVAISGLAEFLKQNALIHPGQLVYRSIRAHRSLQSEMGSGIDVAASAMGGILKYQADRLNENSLPNLTRLRPLSGVYIDAVWTGQSASTSSFLLGMTGFKAREPEAHRVIMRRLTEACRKGVGAYQENLKGRFLKAIDEFSQGLIELSVQSDLPIFSPVHHKLARIAHARGGIYKPSGAGGGDMGLSFTDSLRKQDQMRADFIRAGFQVQALRWGVNGFSLKERKE